AKASPYTMPAPPEDFSAAYRFAFQQGATDIVSLHISGQLSEAVRHALAARDRIAGAPVQVVDTLQAGIGMWPAVTRAAHLARSGASASEIRDAVEATLQRTHLYFMVETLAYLRRGGRLRHDQAMMGTLLDAHPILSIRDGDLSQVESVRPRSRAVARMCELA